MDPASGLFEALDASPTLPETSVSCMITPQQSFHFTIMCNCTYASASDKPPNAYALFSLPVSLFVDKYELEQRFVDGDGPRAQVWGETNLELPLASSRLNTRGSAVLLTLRGEHCDRFHMPLHARYLLPAEADDAGVDIVTIDISLPKLFTSNGVYNRYRLPARSYPHLPIFSSLRSYLIPLCLTPVDCPYTATRCIEASTGSSTSRANEASCICRDSHHPRCFCMLRLYCLRNLEVN